MTAWVDTTAEQKNIWLILIIHGLDGIGWEPVKSQDMDVVLSLHQIKRD